MLALTRKESASSSKSVQRQTPAAAAAAQASRVHLIRSPPAPTAGHNGADEKAPLPSTEPPILSTLPPAAEIISLPTHVSSIEVGCSDKSIYERDFFNAAAFLLPTPRPSSSLYSAELIAAVFPMYQSIIAGVSGMFGEDKNGSNVTTSSLPLYKSSVGIAAGAPGTAQTPTALTAAAAFGQSTVGSGTRRPSSKFDTPRSHIGNAAMNLHSVSTAEYSRGTRADGSPAGGGGDAGTASDTDHPLLLKQFLVNLEEFTVLVIP